MIRNLGKVLTILARQECDENFAHADLAAFGAPSECHRDVKRGETYRFRHARRYAEAVARRPYRVIVREARRRGCPLGGPQWDRAVGRVYERQGFPF
jgi:hypothetical protein